MWPSRFGIFSFWQSADKKVEPGRFLCKEGKIFGTCFGWRKNNLISPCGFL